MEKPNDRKFGHENLQIQTYSAKPVNKKPYAAFNVVLRSRALPNSEAPFTKLLVNQILDRAPRGLGFLY